MQFSRITRTDLVTLLSEGHSSRQTLPFLPSSEPVYPPPATELLVGWTDDPDKDDLLPSLIIVADDGLPDFFAWAITFLPGYRPLTSFVRVLPWTMFSLLRERKPMRRFENAHILVGAILGETLTNATGRGFMESLPLTAIESTYSYVISRALFLGFDDGILDYISGGWQAAREFSGQRTRLLPPASLAGVWWAVMHQLGKVQDKGRYPNSSESISLIIEAMNEIRSRGRLSNFFWERLSAGRLDSSLINDAMKSTREHRVEVFEGVVKNISTLRDELSVSFVVGYLACLVSDGSLEHAHLILPLQGQLPTAMLWYGICAAISAESRVLSDYGHLGLRILRLLSRKDDFESSPQCDISLSELEIMLRGEPRSRSFRQSHASFLRVELAPSVATVIRSPGKHNVSDQPSLFEDEHRQSNVETERLRRLVLSLQGTLLLAKSLLESQSVSPDVEGPVSRKKPRR